MIRTLAACVVAAYLVLLPGGCRRGRINRGPVAIAARRAPRGQNHCDAERLYVRGLAREKAGDVGGAKADWLTCATSDGCDSARAHAVLALGDLCYQAGDAPGAARRYRQCIALVGPRGAPSLQAYFRLGNVLQREGSWAEARTVFTRLVRLFGHTKLAAIVRKRMDASAWTVQVGAFASSPNAEALRRRLAERNLPAIAQASPRERGILHVVTVGRYLTYSSAEVALRDVRTTRGKAFISVAR